MLRHVTLHKANCGHTDTGMFYNLNPNKEKIHKIIYTRHDQTKAHGPYKAVFNLAH